MVIKLCGETEKTHSYVHFHNDGSRMFLTGRLGDPCQCGWVVDFLCDYPVGDGKTCDKRMCSYCAENGEVAPEIHYCIEHHKEWIKFVKSGGVKKWLENVIPLKKLPIWTRVKKF